MIYLASASPRRQELLRQLGLAFEVLPSNLLEVQEPGETARDYVLRVAADKARFVAGLVNERRLPRYPVLGADTEVVLDGEVLGKPRDRAHALALLERLAGRSHEVLSAIAVIEPDAPAAVHSALSLSRVSLGALTAEDRARYWDSGEPAGKTGAYAVQGRAAAFIARLEGSYSGVMGLPLFELVQTFRKLGIVCP